MPAVVEGDRAAGDDAALLAAVARGSRDAFRQLVGRYYDAVYRAVWRMSGGHGDCEDVTQEAFLKLWSNPAQLREPKALKSWLMRVASNLAIDRFRRPAAQSLEEGMEPPDERPNALTLGVRGEAAARIDAAIARLPERQRMALVLVHFEELSNIDAAAAMECSIEAVESLLARARRSLKESLKENWQGLLADIEGPEQ